MGDKKCEIQFNQIFPFLPFLMIFQRKHCFTLTKPHPKQSNPVVQNAKCKHKCKSNKNMSIVVFAFTVTQGSKGNSRGEKGPTKSDFKIEYRDVYVIQNCQNQKNSRSHFGGLVVHRQRNPPNELCTVG